jgi:hypothetical protein
MPCLRWCLAITLASCSLAWAQLPMEPQHDSGQSVTGALEGWFPNPDGSFSILVGYYNRNLKEELDIPIGPDNRIEPGGPDRGQPTHFLPRRQWGVFRVVVPKDFGTNKLTWTITANHQTTVIPLSLDPLWEVSPFSEIGVGNTPPVLSFSEGGEALQGPGSISSMKLTATLANPLTLNVWASDDAKTLPGLSTRFRLPPVTLTWSKFRGPGTVTFSNAKPPVEKTEGKAPFNGKSTTTATFGEAGDYVLLVVANDFSGEGGRGFQCCWTTVALKVSVK